MANDAQRAVVRVSCLDLLTLEGVKELGFTTQFDFLPQEQLEKIYPLLYVNGFDTKKVVQVQACKHRRWDNSFAVGYTIVAFERVDKAWRHGRSASLASRIESNRCPFLKGELYSLSRQAGGYPQYDPSDISEGDFEPDYEQVRSELHALTLILQRERGMRDDVDDHNTNNEEEENKE